MYRPFSVLARSDGAVGIHIWVFYDDGAPESLCYPILSRAIRPHARGLNLSMLSDRLNNAKLALEAAKATTGVKKFVADMLWQMEDEYL